MSDIIDLTPRYTQPPDDFTDHDGCFDQKEFDEFATKQNKTLCKLLNHYQAKFFVTNDMKFKAGSLRHVGAANKCYVGNTKGPSRLYEPSLLVGGSILLGATFAGYPAEGVFPGLARSTYNTDRPVNTEASSRLCNEGTPDQKALDAFKNLTGHDQGYIWSTIKCFADLQYHSERTSSSTGQSLTRSPKPRSSTKARSTRRCIQLIGYTSTDRRRASKIRRPALRPCFQTRM